MIPGRIEIQPHPYAYSYDDYPHLYPWIKREGCRYEIKWDCPEDPNCAYTRWFETEEEAHAFGGRLRKEGCPDDPYYLDEADGDQWRERNA